MAVSALVRLAGCPGIWATARPKGPLLSLPPTATFNERPCRLSRRTACGGALTDGFDSTTQSMRTLFPGVRLGYCLRHALNKLPSKLVGVSAPVRKSLRAKFHTLLHRCRQRTSLRVVALGQRLRHLPHSIATTLGP